MNSKNNTKIRYFVCGIAYCFDGKVLDNEVFFGEFDCESDAKKCFDKVIEDFYGRYATLFEDKNIYYWSIQIEKCEESDKEINCIDVIDSAEIERE